MRWPTAARQAATLTLVVVLPTPPFWLATAMTLVVTRLLFEKDQARAWKTEHQFVGFNFSRAVDFFARSVLDRHGVLTGFFFPGAFARKFRDHVRSRRG